MSEGGQTADIQSFSLSSQEMLGSTIKVAHCSELIPFKVDAGPADAQSHLTRKHRSWWRTLSLLFARNACEVAHAWPSLCKWREDGGQDIAGYAVMLAMILLIIIGTVRLPGNNANTAFSTAASSIQ